MVATFLDETVGGSKNQKSQGSYTAVVQLLMSTEVPADQQKLVKNKNR